MSLDKNLLEELYAADDDGHLLCYTRAIAEKILSQEPSHFPTLLIYAHCLTSLGQYTKAEETLNYAESICRKEKLILVHIRRGQMYRQRGDLLAAEKIFADAYRLTPNDATCLILAGSAAFRRGDLSLAKQYVSDAIKCSEGCIDEAYYNLAGYNLSEGKIDEAIHYYKKALEIDPDYDLAKKGIRDAEKTIKIKGEPAG